MGDYTQVLHLEKPYQAEQYDVDVFNDNFQKIDDFAGLIPPRALTADKLTQAVNINGVSFRGDTDVITGLGLYSETVNYDSTKIAYKIIDNNVVIKKSKIDNNLGNDFNDSTYWQEVALGGGSGHNMFDIVLKDHILTYSETKGFAQLGSYVYKEAIAGSYYGYPDFYDKLLAEYQDVNNTSEVVSGITIIVNANGHKFYNITDKTTIDTIYNNTGEAWYYGIDTTNERIFLPRSTRFKNAQNLNDVGEYQEAGLPNIIGDTGNNVYTDTINTVMPSGCISSTVSTKNSPNATITNTYSTNYHIDASDSSSIYGNSNTVEYSSTKLIPYMVVGNVSDWAGMTDVVNQGMTILEQVANKADISGSNITSTFSTNLISNMSDDANIYLSKLSMPSTNYINLTIGSSGATYTMPSNGWLLLFGYNWGEVDKFADTNWQTQHVVEVNQNYRYTIFVPVLKNEICKVYHDSVIAFRFYYAVGSESEA